MFTIEGYCDKSDPPITARCSGFSKRCMAARSMTQTRNSNSGIKVTFKVTNTLNYDK